METRQSQDNRYIDIACQYHVCERNSDDRIIWTDTHSPVYGGRWDTWTRRYVDDAKKILHIPCSEPQLGYVLDDHYLVEASGGRGGGKSESGVRKVVRNICERPGVDGRVVSPSFKLSRIQWRKLVSLLALTGWILPGKAGIRWTDRELWMHTGTILQFASAHDPDSLRSWGGGYIVVDEAQDVTTEAMDILEFCLREGGKKPQMWMQLTPKPGEPLDRHNQYENNPDCSLHMLSADSNIFVDQDIYAKIKRRCSADRFSIEHDASWDTVRKMVDRDKLQPVFGCLADELVRYEDGEKNLPHEWPGEQSGGPGSAAIWTGYDDVTSQVVRAKMGAISGYRWSYIGGVDPGTSVPNSFTVLKIFKRRFGDKRLIWVVWDYLECKGHCGHLGAAIKADGYDAKDIFVVPDFSAWTRSYLRQPGGSGIAKKGLGPAAARMLQKEGFFVAGSARVNPRVQASVEDVAEKLDPAEGAPRLLFRLPQAEPVFANMAQVVWNKNGKDFDPSIPNDPTDSCRYPISFLDPAARIKNSGIRISVSS